MHKDIIKQVQDMGFDVYMKDEKSTYMYFVEGDNIGYLQYDNRSGFTVCTVHKPNTQSGTGFQIERHVYEINEDMLRSCFVHAPHWARHDAASVRKYKNFEEYKAAGIYASEFKLIEKVTA